MSIARQRELLEENQKLREANRRLQAVGSDMERDRFIQQLHATTIPRAAVAEALAALRAEFEEESDRFDSGLDSWPYDHCRQKLDATIAKLGLQEE